MKAMVLETQGEPLRLRDIPVPEPGPGQALIRVGACAVCRTDLHVLDGDLSEPKLPLVLGHEIVGTVEKLGDGTPGISPGDRIGVPWLGRTCGTCDYCTSGQENLCDDARFIGYDIDGGYAEYAAADGRFCFPIPDGYADADAAPLLCAGIHMSDIPSFPYEILWGERVVRSVASLTRQDGIDFFDIAPKVPVRASVQLYPVDQANQALDDLREGRLNGAAVLTME